MKHYVHNFLGFTFCSGEKLESYLLWNIVTTVLFYRKLIWRVTQIQVYRKLKYDLLWKLKIDYFHILFGNIFALPFKPQSFTSILDCILELCNLRNSSSNSWFPLFPIHTLFIIENCVFFTLFTGSCSKIWKSQI